MSVVNEIFEGRPETQSFFGPNVELRHFALPIGTAKEQADELTGAYLNKVYDGCAWGQAPDYSPMDDAPVIVAHGIKYPEGYHGSTFGLTNEQRALAAQHGLEHSTRIDWWCINGGPDGSVFGPYCVVVWDDPEIAASLGLTGQMDFD